MAIRAEVPLVSLQIWPIDPEASVRRPWAMTEVFAGHFKSGSDGDAGADGTSGTALAALQWNGQSAFEIIEGRLQFIRFTREGRVQYGVPAAQSSDPDTELCGFTALLRSGNWQNRMARESFVSLAPASPDGAPTLLWEPVQGANWETVIPFAQQPVAVVHHLDTLPNQAVKIKTQQPFDANRNFDAVFSFAGTAYGHEGAQAVRLSWGDKWSLAFRGEGANVFASLERRVQARGEATWQVVRVLRDGPVIGASFWHGVHTVSVSRIAHRLVVTLNGVSYWLAESQNGVAIETSWPRAPLRLSVWGADCTLGVFPLTGLSAPNGKPSKDARGKPALITASFVRNVPSPHVRPQTVKFSIEGGHAGGTKGVKTILRGSHLKQIKVAGEWQGEVAHYRADLVCTDTDAPFLSALCVSFPAGANTPAPDPVELRPALSELSFDSGDPESLPNAELTFTLAATLKEKCPGWDSAVLPFRPVLLRAKYPGDATWTTLFRGFLMPQDETRADWNAFDVPLTARGPLVRLSEPAALVDERFGPLDLQLPPGGNLYGAQCVRELLRTELGDEWVANFNGDGNVFRYFNKPYPLLSARGSGFFTATLNIPQKGSPFLPPPFGSDLKSWIGTIAGFDHAVFFFDASEDAFCYGRITEFLRVRSQTQHVVPEGAPLRTDTTKTFPLLSSLKKSGILEKAFNDVRVWSAPPPGGEGRFPALIVGRAGDAETQSLDPLSKAQSWMRTLLMKPDFIKEGIPAEYAFALAYRTWLNFKGRAPARLDATFDTGFLGPRWGEILVLLTGFKGPKNGGLREEWMIMKVSHRFSFNGEDNRFSTVLTTRTMSSVELPTASVT